jgi:predicted enzyme related to lactoylglutathione lyase
MIKITLCSVYVTDQTRAKEFYTSILGFVSAIDVPAGDYRWITVASAQDPGGVQLVLEPLGFAPAATYQAALHVFTLPPTVQPWGVMAVFDDTCGNLIMLQQMAGHS